MTSSRSLETIILFPGSRQELQEVMDAGVKVMSPTMVRVLPMIERRWGGKPFFTDSIFYDSIDSAEAKFRKKLFEEGFSGVIHYSLLMKIVGEVDRVKIPSLTTYGCQGLPVIITPRTYRE